VPRLGYRMVAPVSPWVDQSNGKMGSLRASDNGYSASALSDAPKRGERSRAGLLWAAVAVLCLVLAAAFLIYGKLARNNQAAAPAVATPPQKSIAVLPFLDLTDEMSEEPFADGMTEELIDKLSKIPDLRVPAPTSSFYFKGKLWPRSHGTPQVTIADVAKTLGVTYVLDGSVRKSGGRLRVDARLIRADNGYVVWSEIYDRPFNDILMVQDDIAGEVTKALRASIEARPEH
jgi:transcriptional activator of cad operon